MIYQFVEVQNFSANPLTVGFLGTIVFGVVQAWGLVAQVQTIREKRSGENIPAFLNVFSVGEGLAFSLYGYITHHLAMILNGLLGFFFLAVYLAATQYPDNRGKREWHVLLLLMIPAIWVWPYEWLITLIVVVLVGAMLQWPIKLLGDKHTGALEVKMLWTVLASMIFWAGYFMSTKQGLLFLTNLAGIVILATALALWYHYRAHPGGKSA